MKQVVGKNDHKLSIERANEVIAYDAITGEMRWKKMLSRRAPAGRLCARKCGSKYCINIDGIRHVAHRLAWFIHYGCWPKMQIDHIDLNPFNNAISNLREATFSQNNANRKVRSDSSSGVKGVAWHAHNKKWIVRVSCNKKRVYQAYFDDLNDAALAYQREATRAFGQYARVS